MSVMARDLQESRRETSVAFALSVLIHLLLILGVGWVLVVSPRSQEPEPEDKPMELTILPPEPAIPPTPQFARTNPDAAVKEAPKNAAFESDNNTRAASQAPPTGREALPSVDGRESPAMELEDKNYTAGKQAAPASPSSPPAAEQAPPQEKPTEVAPPLEEPTKLALREAPPKPKTESKPKPQTQPAAKPQPPAAPGFQPETRVTRIRGNISNRGRPSVEAVATPLGRYKKNVSDAIGSRWYYYVNNQIGLLNIGTVSVRFVVNPDGKVKNVRVLSNSSNESFASVSINAIIDAEIPPIPDEVAKILDSGRLEIDYSFTIIGN